MARLINGSLPGSGDLRVAMFRLCRFEPRSIGQGQPAGSRFPHRLPKVWLRTSSRWRPAARGRGTSASLLSTPRGEYEFLGDIKGLEPYPGGPRMAFWLA